MGWLSKLFNLDMTSPTGKTAPKEAPGLRALESQDDATSPQLEACNRLKLVLMHDRTQLSPGILESMRDELVEVISRYVEIDKEALELNLESESNTIALVANIPVSRARLQPERRGDVQAKPLPSVDSEEETDDHHHPPQTISASSEDPVEEDGSQESKEEESIRRTSTGAPV